MVSLVVLESTLPQRDLLWFLLVRRLVDSSVVPRAQRHLVAGSGMPCRNVVDFVTTQGSALFLLLGPFVSCKVRLGVLLLLLKFIHTLALVIPRIDRHRRQALIPPHRLILLVRAALPAGQGTPIVVWLRQLALDPFQLTRRDADGTEHVRFGRLQRQRLSDLLLHLLWKVLLHLLEL